MEKRKEKTIKFAFGSKAVIFFLENYCHLAM